MFNYIKPVIIAIDGPSASGKGTIAKEIANQLGYSYLNTGSLYRTVAYYILKNDINYQDISLLQQLIADINFNDILSLDLNTIAINNLVSIIAAIPEVRQELFNIQRQFPDKKIGAVIEGRDIGTSIFPEADCKLFITASLNTRAQRRFKQLQNAGENIIYSQVLKNLQERDNRDTNRLCSPLKRGEDYIVIDNTDLTLQSSLELVLKLIKEKINVIVT